MEKITPKQRERMISRLSRDILDEMMDDARANMLEYILHGAQGLEDCTDEELLEEYVAAYGPLPE